MKFKIRKGLDLPLNGEPKQELDSSKSIKSVALTGADYVGMKPTMHVKEGDQVKLGQPLFECKKNEGLIFTSPAAGKVVGIHRGPRRVFESLVIDVSANEEKQSFASYTGKDVTEYTSDQVRKLLIESGEWTSLRQRPYEKVADVKGEPKAIFVNTMDTNPHALQSDVVLSKHKEDFERGLKAMAALSRGPVYISLKSGSNLEVPAGEKFKKLEFLGPHPAGNVGTHIHFADPVSPKKYVWHINYQDLIAIGSLFATGELMTQRYISLAGPKAKNPRLLKVRKGASLDDICKGELEEPESTRVISGSVLNGRKRTQNFAYLGHYHHQVAVIKEDPSREFMGWQSPGFNKFSVQRIYLSKLMPFKKFDFTSNRNGSYRAMVPIGSFEKVMPLDILPTQLLRALVSKDTDMAQDLGCLELAEEDLSLLTFVSPGKVDFAPALRESLSTIEREG